MSPRCMQLGLENRAWRIESRRLFLLIRLETWWALPCRIPEHGLEG